MTVSLEKIEELNQDNRFGLTILDEDTDFYYLSGWKLLDRATQRRNAKDAYNNTQKNGSYIQASLPISQGHRYSVTCQ